MGKKIIYTVLLLAILAAAYWWSRAYVRLPFDQVSPFQAVSQNSNALIGLPNLGAPSVALKDGTLWYLDTRRITKLLDTLDLATEVAWKEWWLLPEIGDGAQDAAYTFIGVAEGGFSRAWNPDQYGPTLGFGDGEIYSYGIATDDPIYFARYHNLFLAGKYPFQIENALLSAQGKIASWEEHAAFAKLLPQLKHWPTTDGRLIFRTENAAEALPAGWLKPTDVKAYQEVADWMALRITARDSSARIEGVLLNETARWSPWLSSPYWGVVPEVADRVLPLDRKEGGSPSGINSWLGDGGWQIELAGSRSPERIAPRLWVLPVGDSIDYAKFRTTYLNPDRYLEEANYQLFDLIQLRSADGMDILSDRKVWQPWVVELPNEIVVGVYREDVERYLDYYMLGAGLDKKEAFLQLAGQLELDKQQVAGFYQWGPLADRETNWLHLLFPEREWSTNGSLYFGARATGDGLWEVEGVIGLTPAAQRQAALRWTSSLPVPDGDLRLLPVRSATDGLPRHFMLQAPNGDCWLLDEFGQTLWQNRALPELLPPVWRTSLPGGRIAYAAASRTQLYIWDEQGSVRNIPRKTPAPSAGLTLVQFDQISAPNIVFPTQEGTIEMLDWEGIPAQGWPVQLSGRVVATDPVTHWQYPEEDYLIAWTGEESWQMFGRFGNFLTSLSPVPEAALGAPGLEFDQAEPAASRLLTATASGKINVWDLEGNIFPLPLGRGPVDNFLFTNVWGDRRGDYVAQRGALVHLFGYTENNDFRERWQQRLGFVPTALLPAEPLGLIAVQQNPDQLWLIDGEGEIAPGFPLPGAGNAVLSGDSQSGYFLVTTVRGEVYGYELE